MELKRVFGHAIVTVRLVERHGVAGRPQSEHLDTFSPGVGFEFVVSARSDAAAGDRRMDVDSGNLSPDRALKVVVRVRFHPAEAHDPIVAFRDDEVRSIGFDRIPLQVVVVRPRCDLFVDVVRPRDPSIDAR